MGGNSSHISYTEAFTPPHTCDESISCVLYTSAMCSLYTSAHIVENVSFTVSADQSHRGNEPLQVISRYR